MKNKIKINKRCNYREWPIRRQLMFSFLCTTILLQLILVSVIFGNIEYMITQTDTQVYDKVNDHSNQQFYQIANQAGLNLQTHIYYLSQQLQNIVYTFPQLLNPILGYQSQFSYTNCQTVQQINQYDVCFYTNNQTLDTNTLELISKMQNYNQYLQYLFVESLKSQIQVILSINKILSILIYDPIQSLEIYLIYPSQKINFYNINKKQFQGYQLSGPYLNILNESQVMMNIQQQITYKNYRLYFTLEFPISSIQKYYLDINYYLSTIIVLTSKSGSIIYAPQNWNLSYQNQIEKIQNYPQLSGFNLTRIPIKQISNIEIQNQTYRLMKLQFSGYYESNQLSSFIDNINTQVDFYVYLYVIEDQLLTTFSFINGIMQKEEIAIIFINISTTILTISLVFIFTYMIAVRVSRPLNKLVKIAKYMSNNLTKKNITGEILYELNLIEATNQIADLLKKFRGLVESIKNQSNSKKSMVKKNVVQYPLNQYDPEFIKKTKNKTDVNWGPIINEIDE